MINNDAILLFIISLIPFPGLTTAMILRIGYLNGIYAFPYVFISSLLGSCVSFIIARKFIKIPLSWTNLTQLSIENSWTMVIALRLSPSPSSILSYVIGSMKHISFDKYVIATIIGYQKLWIELMIGYNMNEVSSAFKENNVSKILKSIVSFVGLFAIAFIIKKIYENLCKFNLIKDNV